MEIVNGIPCLNCSDVERAKKAPSGDASVLNQNVFSASSAAPRSFASIAFPSPDAARGRTFDFGV